MATSFANTIKSLLKIADQAQTSASQGKAFEDLVCHLFLQIPGITLATRNQKNQAATEEIDIACWNERDPAGLKFLDSILLVECKNWSSPVGSMDVNWFTTKVENRGLDFGILIAANGITGAAADRTAAHDVVSKALARRIRIIVITRAEIEILDSGLALVQLIKTKLCQLVVSGSVWP